MTMKGGAIKGPDVDMSAGQALRERELKFVTAI